MNNIPPLVSSAAGNGNRNSFARQAATASFAAPLFAIALTWAAKTVLPSLHQQDNRNLILAQGLLSFLLMVTGLILGVTALLSMKSGNRRGVAVRAMIGILLSGGLLAIFVPNFVRARASATAQHQSPDQVRAAAKDFKTEAAKTVNEGRTPDPSRVIQSIDQASQTATGDTAAVLKGMTSFFQNLQQLQADYAKASAELTVSDVLRGKNLTEREQLQTRKAVVQRFLDANAALRKAVESSDDNYGAELRKQNVSPADLAAALASYHKSNAVQAPLAIEVRAADDRIGTAMLGTLTLLDENWGQWHFDATSNRKLFNNADALQKYTAFVQEIDSARQDQTAAQQKLAAVMSQPVPEP